MTCKSLFKVLVDEFELYIVADNEKEAENHCFSCFDYNKIKVKYIHKLKSHIGYPYFVPKEELYVS